LSPEAVFGVGFAGVVIGIEWIAAGELLAAPSVYVGQWVALAEPVVRRGRRCEIARAPVSAIIDSPTPAAAPMPASPQSKPLGALMRTIVGGTCTKL
jgi:hypothetical protein